MKWFKKKKKQDVPEQSQDSVGPPQEAAVSPQPSPPADIEPETSEPGKSEPGKSGVLGRLRKGLSKTRAVLTTDIEDLLPGGKKLDEQTLEELEEMLITADVGVETSMAIIEGLERQKAGITGGKSLKAALKSEILSYFPEPAATTAPRTSPHVVMVVGVNGVGKTTTIGKLAAKWGEQGESVLIAAADTFRAAAVEQLEVWAKRAGADFVRHKAGADPAAVAFDGVAAGQARKKDRVIVDTAGRLHTQANLMAELKKIYRAMGKQMADAPHEVLLVLDATTGQNAISQAKMFHEALTVNSLALTKLDGTARGGIVIGICRLFDIPLKYIGVGERIEDLQKFDARAFVDALF